MRTSNEIFARTAANRRRYVDAVAALDPAAYDTPTLCAGWTVHHLTAHLAQPHHVGFWGFLRASEALAMAAGGRTAALADLAGPGVALLAERLRR